MSHTLAQCSTTVSLQLQLPYSLSLYLIYVIHEEAYINNTSKEETKPELLPNPNSKVQGASPKVECSGHTTRRVP